MTPNVAQKKVEKSIRSSMRELRCAIRSGDDSKLVIWVIKDQLACAQRPLRDHPKFGGRKPLPPDATDLVIRWVDRILRCGFRSIICLSHCKELKYYDGLALRPCGLIEYLRSRGLVVCHLPWPDPAHSPTPEERKRRKAMVEEIKNPALAAFRQLPKPVLMFCSAGIDRSPPVAAFIVGEQGDV